MYPKYTFVIIILSIIFESVDLKSYSSSSKVQRIPKDIQSAQIKKQLDECAERIISYFTNKSKQPEDPSNQLSPICPPAWDKIMCWPATLPETTVYQPCPNYIDGFKFQGNVSRKCLGDAKWFRKKNSEWSNYTDCQPTPNKFATHYIIIHIIGQIGYSISMFFLALASIILLSFRRLRCERNKIHVSLFLSYMLRAALYFPSLSQDKKTSKFLLCRTIKTAQNYAITTNNLAVFIEAIYLHNIIFFHTFSGPTNRLYYYIGITWGAPAIILMVWVTMRVIYDNHFCWDTHDDPLKRDFWLLQSISIMLTLGCVPIFINLMRSIYSKMSTDPTNENNFSRRLTRSICVLVLVFGVYNLVFIPIDIETAISDDRSDIDILELIKLYCEHLISSFHGLLVSILFCFNHKEVIFQIRKWKSQKFPSSTRNSEIPLSKRQCKRQPYSTNVYHDISVKSPSRNHHDNDD